MAALALRAVSGQGNPFCGKMDKTVIHRSVKAMPAAVASKFRSGIMEEVDARRADRPFKVVPYQWYRLCPIFGVAKNKHNPLCGKIRPISHFSAGRDASVNSLCFTPKLIGFHPRAMHIRDSIAECGRDAWLYGVDIPHCFRWVPLKAALRRLFVYEVKTKAHGKEFFVDGCNPFGWTPSEWKWQCILAVLVWALRHKGLPWLIAYVDNFFLIRPKADLKFSQECNLLDSTLRAFGLDLHEQQFGHFMKALGWLWDSTKMLMICPEDKFTVLCSLLGSWASQALLSLADLEKACGFMYWLSAGFTYGRSSVGYLICDRTKAQAIHRRVGGLSSSVMIKVSEESRLALEFWNTVFSTWDRTCPIVQA